MIRIRRPYDFHVHLRDGDMLREVLPHTSENFAAALIMPNTMPPIRTVQDVFRYQEAITGLIKTHGSPRSHPFQPLMTIKLTAQTTREVIKQCAPYVQAAKLYPEGVTTNSSDGVREISALYPIFEVMQDVGMTLCLHGETPGVFSMDREANFLLTLWNIVQEFPKLRVVLEHVTTAAAVECVQKLPDTVAATITVHHLFITLDDVVGNMLQPHNFCKPIAKRPEDRSALLRAAKSGNSKFFLGTDSAPHAIGKKECASGCAGVFTAPVAMSLLAEVFDRQLDELELFTSTNGCQFYGLNPTRDYVDIEEEPWVVPEKYGDVVPFRAGQTLKHTVRDSILR